MPARKKRLEWSKTALAELAEGMAFYAARNPDAARRMLDEINVAALSLIAPTLPASGKLGRVPGTRELVLGRGVPLHDHFSGTAGRCDGGDSERHAPCPEISMKAARTCTGL